MGAELWLGGRQRPRETGERFRTSRGPPAGDSRAAAPMTPGWRAEAGWVVGAQVPRFAPQGSCASVAVSALPALVPHFE